MGQVLFFPTTYWPDFEEQQRLLSWQRSWDLWRAKLRYDQREAKLTGFQAALSTMRYHTGVRDNWKLYQGLKEEIEREEKRKA